MCGINGIFAYHGAAKAPRPTELIATREAMRSRGPDGSDAWWSGDGRCALAHRRLAIVELSSRGAQPMRSEDGRLHIVFNGEIYNYRQIRNELVAKGARFRSKSDTEVLLHLFAHDGEAMVHRLRGMFAFAIFDEQAGRLFLARDPYGIKPLYIANDGSTFRFASQVKALLAGNAISRETDPAGVVGFHLMGSVPDPFTLYRSIQALPAGHVQWVDAKGAHEPKTYASLAKTFAVPSDNPPDPDELRDRVREATLSSVQAHLVADVEVGLFLSAGIDLGALLGLMRDAGQEKIRALTLRFAEFAGTTEDESPLAAKVAARYGAKHAVRTVSEKEFRDDLPAILDAMDQPSVDGLNTWFVAKAAREAGLKVALSGVGGDELFAGYPSFAELPRWRRTLAVPARLPGMGRLFRWLLPVFAPGVAERSPKAAGLLEYGSSWEGLYLLRRGLRLPFDLPHLLDKEVVREGLERLQPLEAISASVRPAPRGRTARVAALESANYLRNQLLRDSDWAGMAHSVEIRTPLVDFALLKQLAPIVAHFGRGVGKSLLAAAPTKGTADEITARSKTGFNVPTGAWSGDGSPGASKNKGQASREWAQKVLAAAGHVPRRPVAA